MKIHTRTLLILGATIFILIFAMNGFAQYFIPSSDSLMITEVFLIAGIFFVLTTEFLLRRYIIEPLMDLDTAMIKVGKNRDLSENIAINGDEEIASLKISFNRMLQELAVSQATLAMQSEQLAEANRKANMYLDIYLDVVSYEILNAINSLDGYAESDQNPR